MGTLAARILDAARILEETGGIEAVERNSNFSRMLRGRGVIRSMEFLRVKNLPRRVLLGEDDGEELARAVSDLLYWAAGGESPSPLPLRPMQAAMLVDATEHRGALASLPVGAGKSWAMALFATAPGGPRCLGDAPWPQIVCERPVLLLPSSVKTEMINDVLPLLGRTYRIHPNLKLISYGELQTVKGANLLNELRPDLIVADEVHNLAALTSARTKRVRHYIKQNPQTIFIGMTATLSDTSLRNYHHLLMWSHPNDPPLPRGWKEVEDWANAVDAKVPEDERLAPGALIELCRPDEVAREGLQRRLADTSGVILAQEASIDIPLTLIARRDVTLPSDVVQALDDLDDAWVTPDGEPVPDAARYAQRARELALGFYYVWDWSRCTADGAPDYAWLEARNDWVRIVRDVCRRGNPDFDSELRVRNGCKAGTLPHSIQADAQAALERWREQSKKPEPETKAVWLTDAVMQWVREWLNEAPGIVWFEHRAIGAWLEREWRGPVYGSGANDELREHAQGPRAGRASIACSRPAHFQGKNLQAWHRNLVLTPSPNGKIWEQMIGRTHRARQTHHEVTCDFLAHTEISFRSMAEAVNRARYAKETLGSPQKLLSCIAVGWSRGEHA